MLYKGFEIVAVNWDHYKVTNPKTGESLGRSDFLCGAMRIVDDFYHPEIKE